MAERSVVICGGGLAGLTLGLQLAKELPQLRVSIIEKTKRPLPDAAHKVGESSVELASHYFGEVLGLKDYLLDKHLIKNGLRFFPGSNHQAPLEERVEIGPPELPRVPSYQIDRGVFENDLRALCEQAGVALIEGKGVYRIELADEGMHRVLLRDQAGTKEHIGCDWVIDASGRRRLLQSQLGLKQSTEHASSAAWFRVEGLLDIKDLSSNVEWQGRDPNHIRYLSTNHLMGEGYWVWMIPLASGHTSIGLVAYEKNHPLRSYGTRKKLHAWLQENEPALFAKVADIDWLDFKRIENYSFGTKRFLSGDRWACVGEAAMFADPLYSPGSDFIALHNSFVTETIRRDLMGEDATIYADRFNDMTLAVLEYTVSLYRDMGHVFTKPHVYATKLYWDNFGYWSFLCPYFFQDVYRLSADEMLPFEEVGKKFGALVPRGQKLFSAWAKHTVERPYFDHLPFPKVPSILANLHLALEERMDKDALLAFMKAQLALYEELYDELAFRALKDVGEEKAVALLQDAEIEELRTSEKRLVADEKGKRGSKVARDVTRVVGAPKGDSTLAMRDLFEGLSQQGHVQISTQ